MRTLLMVLVFFGVVSFTGYGETMGARYYRRGVSTEHRTPYTTNQNYYLQSSTSGAHLRGQSQFQTQWELENRYRLDAYGRPIAGGRLAGSGGGQRVYLHNGEPSELQRIEAKEEEIARRHLEYLNIIDSGNKQIAHYNMELEKLRRDNSKWAQDRIPGDEAMIRANQSLNRIFARWNNEALSGNP